ncbi:MAG TPA: protein-L-isoaspartate O-methyltransferase, partial [Gammaproteobacteria bacterium]|nr:protein-L-isoaspartate O-methyltransferase [Gammaproteobacteria bacterium]
MQISIRFPLVLITMISIGVMAAGDYDKQRRRMIEDINDTVSFTSDYIGKDSLDEPVMQAMERVPRHLFVPEEIRSHAYVNSALPIGNDQTISQPYIVALMTDLAGVGKNSVVLEVGTGSGYQAAILAEIVKEVYTIEIIRELGEQAAETLAQLGYQN